MSEAAGFPEFRKRKDQNFLQTLNRILLILIGLIVVIGLLAAFSPALEERNAQKSALDQIQRQVAAQRDIFQKRSKEVTRLNNDPEYLEDIARDKLELMKEGETVFRFEDSTNSTPGPQTP